jgi:hypothetical protein
MLQVGDQLRYGGLGNPEVRGGLGQAAPLHDRKKYMEVPQPQTSADMVVPIDYSGHKPTLSSMKENQEFHLYRCTHSIAIKPRIRTLRA